ncbi:hypothetical protein M758_1G146400 [Ceratodon purpureus]|uniref:Uncharacterized protein n=1 Tax=Ceratodon purpureus TaxID=3225 RepID=A0A8T0J8A0_CERPU|nr:hypothetical protein KC19_1G149700 [Ceratodon purpureus]KAG0630002.1 hypothetical protein M758_1G146400 [Ceratodon purpureus]
MTWKLQEGMFTNWLSFSCPKPNPEGLWKYEWKKHESCSGMDRPAYFETAIALHTNILEAFRLEVCFSYPNSLQVL